MSAPEELGGLASQVTADYNQLAIQGRLAAATAEPEEVNITWTITTCFFLAHTLTLALLIVDWGPDKDTCAGVGEQLHCSRPEGRSAADHFI